MNHRIQSIQQLHTTEQNDLLSGAKEQMEWYEDITLNTRISRRHRFGFRVLGRFYCLVLGSRLFEKFV